MTDQKAIEGCKKQDRISQKYLFDKYSDGMLMVCVRYVKQLPDAEEAMLSGFYNFFRTIDRFIYTAEGGVGAWLRKIMVNECLMFLRKKGGLKIVEEDVAVEISAGDQPGDDMSAKEILNAVMMMPEGYRTVFNLFVLEGYGHKEIAGLLNITEGTSKSQLNKARAHLQKVMKEKGYYHEK